ncbi:MAG: SPOR domain-containing protein, partial [Desulfobacula sp.]|nr:SPOR domain-containing protein [Desulfobacula sp.]
TTKHNKKQEGKKTIKVLKSEPAQIKQAQEISKDTKPQNTGYAIQTGAFLNQANAIRMKTKLVNMGFDSRVLILKDSKDKTWYLVRSGNYADKNNSQKDFSLLKEKLGSQPVIRPVGAW